MIRREIGAMPREEGPYKSEQNISIALATAFENKTMRQMLVNTGFPQRELGMSAGRLRRSRRFSHRMKAGIRAMLSTNKAIFAGSLIFVTVRVKVLHDSQLHQPAMIIPGGIKTHAST